MQTALDLFVKFVLISSETLLVGAALHDIATRTVPNWVSVALLAMGVMLRVHSHNLGWGLLAAGLVFAVTVFCWRRGWMGGADVKLFTASAILVPPNLVASLVLASSLAGGLLVIIYVILRPLVGRPPAGRPGSLISRIWRVERRRIKRLESLPYASAIAAGALSILLTV